MIMDPITLTLLTIILGLIIYAIYNANQSNKYWEKRGIPYVKPMSFFSTLINSLLMKKHFSDLHIEYAKQFPDTPYFGIMNFRKPILMVTDLDLIEKILIKDFMYFTDRGVPSGQGNAFDISLFTMNGKEWRALRYKLSPMFTTGKMKKMYGSMADCGEVLSTLLECDETQDVDMKEILGRFAMDVIGSCAFGLDAKNLSDPDNKFRKMGRKTFEFSISLILKFTLFLNFPKLAKWLKISATDVEAGEYFCKIIKDTIEYRKQNNVVRNDFLQQLMILKDKGSIELQIKDPADDYLRMEPTVETFEINEDTIIGQAFTFLTAGFETTAITMMFTLYEISKNMNIQDKVRAELNEIISAEGGSLTYNAVKRMTYLEQCVKESLRKYPPASTLPRKCTKLYTLPNGTVLTPDDSVFIPLRIIHNNPKYFPEPEEFRPERFDPDQKIPPCAFMPFGNGPRICIAMRFALMEVAYCLAKLLVTYEFKVSPKTKPLRMKANSFFTAPADPILFHIRKIMPSV